MLALNPLTQKKLTRFRQIKRSYYSFILLSLLILLSCIAEVFINNKALMVSYNGSWYFPTYSAVNTGETFGLDYAYEVDYRQLAKDFDQAQEGNWVILPLVPWNAFEQDFDGINYPPNPPSCQNTIINTQLRHRYLRTRRGC